MIKTDTDKREQTRQIDESRLDRQMRDKTRQIDERADQTDKMREQTRQIDERGDQTDRRERRLDMLADTRTCTLNYMILSMGMVLYQLQDKVVSCLVFT